MNKIKSIGELPNWFDLDNYFNREFSEHYLFEQVRDKSVCFLEQELGIWLSIPDNYPVVAIEGSTPITNTAIHPINLINAQCMGEAATELINESSTEEIGGTAYDLLFSDTGYEANISINLNAPDYQILQELKQLLPGYRKELKARTPRKLFKQTDLRKILEYKIIPLSDLILWSKAEKKSISLNILADALFPDGSKDEEDIRKTVIPFMEKVISEQYVKEWESRLIDK